MAGRSTVVADEQQRIALAELAHSHEGAEADRAHCILLTLSGLVKPASGRGDRETFRCPHFAFVALGGVVQKRGFRWQRPRHTLKGRQDAAAVNRGGLRRILLKAQAEAGDIVLLFGDESEALTHPYFAHAWAKKSANLRMPAPGQAAKVAMLVMTPSKSSTRSVRAIRWGRQRIATRSPPGEGPTKGFEVRTPPLASPAPNSDAK
jgi:hypothetical protein